MAKPETSQRDAAPETPEMQAFYRALADKRMDALWRGRAPGRMTGEPKAPYPPCHWSWSDIRPAMARAGELVEPGPDAERRVLRLVNPALPELRSASHTLTANVQMVLPGETAPTHRHTSGAIRFIIEGEAAMTIVNGEPVEMRPGDLVLTPAWHWHGHISHSDKPMLWMDTLDRPLTTALGQMIGEHYPTELEPITKPNGDSRARYGGASLRPIGERASSPVSPLYSYAWSETEQALNRMAISTPDPFDDIAFDYVNPLTGGHVLPTIGCRIQMIRPGIHTRAHRHACTGVYHVFRGAGFSVVDGVRIDWQEGDFFALPPHCWHEHANPHGKPAILFSTTDAPVIDALHLHREDAYQSNSGQQPVTATYGERYGAAQ